MTSETSPPTITDAATAIWDKRYEGGAHVGATERNDGDPIDYTQHPFLWGHSVAKPLTGRLDGYRLGEIAEHYLKPRPGRVLALGSGMAFAEEFLLSQGAASHVVAYEMSPVACAAATKRVADKPYAGRLEMRSRDVLEDALPDGSFDVVFVMAAIHHFERIDEMFALMHRVLRADGLLIYDEYVGPDHHLYHDGVLRILDEINACLAPNYRWDSLAHQIRERVPVPSLEWMLSHDPTEGVHASRILPLTYEWFEVLERSDYGGTVMRPFFTGILPNFDWEDPKDQTVARLIVLTEQLLTRYGVIPHYHTTVVARRRPARRDPIPDWQLDRIGYSGWTEPPPFPPRPTRALNRIRRAMAELMGRPLRR